MESEGLGGPRWHGSSWQRGIAESGSSWPSTCMIDTSGDPVWDQPCVQQTTTWKGAHCYWCCPSICMLIKNPMIMMMMIWNLQQSKSIGWACAQSQNSDNFLLLVMYTLDFLRNMALLYTWHSRVRVSATYTVFKIMIWNLQQSKNIGRACA